MVGTVIGAGISSYLSASAARSVANAEAALEQKRRLAREMDSKIQNIEIDLNLFLVEKNGMVSRIDFYQRCQTRDIGDSKARGVLGSPQRRGCKSFGGARWAYRQH